MTKQLIRAGFAALLESEPDITVVGQAGTGAEAVEQVSQHRPDVVLMDIRMPGSDGLWATELIQYPARSYRDSSSASPWPPPPHRATAALPVPRRASSSAACRAMRPPLDPIG